MRIHPTTQHQERWRALRGLLQGALLICLALAGLLPEGAVAAPAGMGLALLPPSDALPAALWLSPLLAGAQIIMLLLALTQWASVRKSVYLCLAVYIAASAIGPWVQGQSALWLPAEGESSPVVLQGLTALEVLCALQLCRTLLGAHELPLAGRQFFKVAMAATMLVGGLFCWPATAKVGQQVLELMRPVISAGLLLLVVQQVFAHPRRALPWVAAWAVLRLGSELLSLQLQSWPADLSPWAQHLRGGELLMEFLLIQAFFGRRLSLQRQLEQEALSAQLEARVERLKREELGQFLIMFGHEVRTPLAVIDSATQTLEMLPGADAPLLRQRHQRIRSAVKRLDSLANEALSRERCEAGRAEVRLRPVDWPRLMSELLSMYTPALLPATLEDGMEFPMTIGGDPDGRLRLELPTHWPALMADLELTHFALGNLLDNARKYGHRKTTVVLRVECSPGTEHESDQSLVRCSVTSVGPELTRSELALVFQKYWRRKDSGQVGGAGLGLHLVQTIATLHRGRVEAQGLSGSRTRFTLVYPGRDAGSAPLHPTTPALETSMPNLQVA